MCEKDDPIFRPVKFSLGTYVNGYSKIDVITLVYLSIDLLIIPILYTQSLSVCLLLRHAERALRNWMKFGIA